MPKETFFNLPDEKRNRITAVAIRAFASKDYQDVTISGMVKEAKIPKGSFYQYFEDKFDVFQYLLQIMGEKKIEYFAPIMPKINTENFFDIVGDMYIAGLRFSHDYPDYAEIGSRLMKISDPNLLEKIYADLGGKVDDFLGPVIRLAIEKGEIRDDIDPEFLSFAFGKFNTMFAEYFFKVKKKDNFDEYIDDINMMLDLFKNGAMKR